MLNAIWFVPPVLHMLAERDGLFAGQDIGIDARATTSSDEQFEALRDGTRDFAVTSMDNVVMWKRREGGQNLRIVAQVETTTGIDLIARPEIASIADLGGKRLLVDSSENGFVIALHKLLADAGVDYHGCTIIEAGGVKERLASLAEGKGDATLLGPPFTGMAQAQGMVRIIGVNDAYPDFAGQGIIMRTDAPASVQEEMVRYLNVLDKARDKARRDPEGALDRLVEAGGARGIIENLVGAVGGTLLPDPAGIALIIEHRRSLGRPGGEDLHDDLVDPALLHRALATADR